MCATVAGEEERGALLLHLFRQGDLSLGEKRGEERKSSSPPTIPVVLTEGELPGDPRKTVLVKVVRVVAGFLFGTYSFFQALLFCVKRVGYRVMEKIRASPR